MIHHLLLFLALVVAIGVYPGAARAQQNISTAPAHAQQNTSTAENRQTWLAKTPRILPGAILIGQLVWLLNLRGRKYD